MTGVVAAGVVAAGVVAVGFVAGTGGCVVVVTGATLAGVVGAGLLSPPIFCAKAEPVNKVKVVR